MVLAQNMGDQIWSALTGKVALVIYAVLLAVLIALLVAWIIFAERRRAIEAKENSPAKAEAARKEALDEAKKSIDKKLDSFKDNLVFSTGSGGGGSTYSTGRNVSKSEGDEEVNEGGSRFYMLTEIDKQYEDYTAPAYNNGIGLREICEIFRNYSAGTLKLYYDIEDIRRFIGALAVTKLIILQGMSGTGKTSLAYAFGEFLDNKTVVVPIQPMWKERTDLVGYYNEFTRRFNETTLLYKMYEANCNEEIYITVLDEMNIARVEYYFAEFLSLLEIPNPDGRNLDVVADRWEDDPKLLQKNGKLRLPTNMWFVGTANNDDSTFSISDKVYDRAMVLNLDKKAIPFDAPATESMKLSATHLEELFKRAQREYDLSDRNLRRIKKLDEYMIQTFHITFGNRIMKQIRTYVPVLVACGGTELEALDDILSRKVFRKLESKNPVYVKQMADGVCSYLDELFGEDKLPLCKEAIRLIEQNV
ncbi:MAG: AAA family ATPase [Clostridia bacterium]|nr:AAA family ATPase [Clostridia bacterium]